MRSEAATVGPVTSPAMDLDTINARIAEAHRGKKWILTADAAAGATTMVDQLREWESGPLMIVAAIEGVGDLPEVERIFYIRRDDRPAGRVNRQSIAARPGTTRSDGTTRRRGAA